MRLKIVHDADGAIRGAFGVEEGAPPASMPRVDGQTETEIDLPDAPTAEAERWRWVLDLLRTRRLDVESRTLVER